MTARALPKAVLMDLDGTLADTARDLVPALNELCAEEGHPSVDYEQARNQVSQGARALIRHAFGDTGELQEQQLVSKLLDRYARNPCVRTVLFDGMPELLGYLAKRNIAWGVVTNKPAFLTEPLMAGLQLPFPPRCVISGDTLRQRKPHPAPLREAARRIGAAPVHCLYLGDDPRDMQAARAAGMTGIVAGFGYIAPGVDPNAWDGDGMIEHPEQLKSYLDGA